MPNKIDEILDKIWGWASCGLEIPERDYKKDEFLAQAKLAIYEELKGLVIDMEGEYPYDDTHPNYQDGYNNANALWRERLKDKIMGGER